jgi:RNA-directed DNA polymerase
MESAKGWQPTAQGAVISPLLSNIYLDGQDWTMARRGFAMVRYAADFIVLCRDQQEAQEALEQVRQLSSLAAVQCRRGVHCDKFLSIF